ncbi:MAG: Bax inhibitor-1/YccA family protein [Sphaerochaetaceae bacterium]|nr:Bax inhibitor-1/YccA family protein [Sphaerochaetaceae bacterium]
MANNINYASTSDVKIRERSIIKNVYAWMSAGLGLTALTAYGVAANQQLMTMLLSNRFSFMMLFIVQIGLVMYLSSKIQDLSKNASTIAFLAYAFVTGVTFSTIFYAFQIQTIFLAFLTSALMFGGMAAYAQFTKKDLSGIGYYSRMAVWGIIVTMLLNFFFRSAALDYFISLIGVAAFLGLTAWDVQKIKRTNEQFVSSMSEIDYHRASIYGALTLYLDFINLFLFLLRIFGGRDN